MSDASSLTPESNADDELKDALRAAFGSDGISFLDDDDDDFESDQEQLPAAAEDEALETATPAEEAIGWIGDKHDSPRTRWIKQVSTAILANDIRALSGCSYRAEKSEPQANRCVLFSCGSWQFGVPLGNVCEVARYPSVTELPRTPAWLRGVANIRGQITSVTDLSCLFEIPRERPTNGEKIIVVRGSRCEPRTALVVDQVLGIRSIENKPQDNCQSGKIADFATGSVIIEQEKTILLDLDRILGWADRL
jgi:chemotaxis signal transduction protein